METVSVLLIDDNETFLRQATRFLEREPHLEVAGTARNGGDGVRRAAELQPRVILLDIAMPGESGFEIASRLKEAAPGCCLIALTMHEAAAYREHAFTCGMHGYVTKGRMVEELIPEIRRLAGISAS